MMLEARYPAAADRIRRRGDDFVGPQAQAR